MKKDDVKRTVRDAYAKAAENGSCCAPATCCCGPTSVADELSRKMGYTDTDLRSVPEGANMGLGCGNPIALASLSKGEVVLDLGSGGGLDCFLAAQKVGAEGRVIGVDMTPEMIERARGNARSSSIQNVEFRLGEIENLPVGDSSVDVVISNCVINLSPDKKRVFQEAFRALKPGGRLMISDIVLLRDLPDFIKESKEAYVACLAGAILKEEYLNTVREAGFVSAEVLEETPFRLDCVIGHPSTQTMTEKLGVLVEALEKLGSSIISLKLSARKPVNNNEDSDGQV